MPFTQLACAIEMALAEAMRHVVRGNGMRRWPEWAWGAKGVPWGVERCRCDRARAPPWRAAVAETWTCRLWAQISLKMLSFLTRLSVFEDQYTVEKPRVMRIE